MTTITPDFSDSYNTSLSGPDEVQFRIWAARQRRGPGQSALSDLYDYDLRGWWKKNGSQDLTSAHLTDEFKKPNHPTFSTESMYHGKDGHVGGEWIGSDSQGWAFLASDTNLKMRGAEGLQKYFAQFEPNTKLLMSEMTEEESKALGESQTRDLEELRKYGGKSKPMIPAWEGDRLVIPQE